MIDKIAWRICIHLLLPLMSILLIAPAHARVKLQHVGQTGFFKKGDLSDKHVCKNWFCDPQTQAQCQGTQLGDRITVINDENSPDCANKSCKRDRFLFFSCCEGEAIQLTEAVLATGLDADKIVFNQSYISIEGPGNIKFIPSDDNPNCPVCAGRRYSRGACLKWEENDMLRGVAPSIAEGFKNEIKDHSLIKNAEVFLNDIDILLGTPNCSATGAKQQDLFLVTIRLKVVPHTMSGYWNMTTNIFFKIDVGEENKFAYCVNNKCSKCSVHAECYYQKPGSKCIDGECVQDNYLDASIFGVINQFDQHCGSDPMCFLYYSQFQSEINNTDFDEKVLDPLMASLYEKLWTPIEGNTCERGAIAKGEISFYANQNMEVRCGPDGVLEVRPGNIYQFNLYPKIFEVVLAWDNSDPAATLLEQKGLCETPTAMTMVPAQSDWPLNEGATIGFSQ